MDDDPIDLSLLDPSRDQERWSQLVASVAARAVAAHRRRFTVSYQVRAWARPVLGLAAAAALASWIGAMMAPARDTRTARSDGEPAYVLAGWASDNESPPPASIIEVLGGSHAID